MNPELCESLSQEFGMTVQPLLQPGDGPRSRDHTAVFDQKSGIFTLNGNAEMRLTQDAQNWHRLSQNAQVRTKGAAAPDTADLINLANNVPASARRTGEPQTLFVVTNGVGLGHLTRLLAIALELRSSGASQPVFWSYSRAAGLLEAHGFPVILRQTAAHLEADRDVWKRWETKELARYIRANPVAGIVYDGSNIGSAIGPALREPGCGSCAAIWVRRGMWQSHWDASVLEATEICDLVLEPGDIAAAFDSGATATYQPRHTGYCQKVVTSPVVLTAPSQMLARAKARRALGVRGRKPLCLINLGAHAMTTHGSLTTMIETAQSAGKVQFLWARSPLADPGQVLSLSIPQISLFPLGNYLHAFDGIISAAGYNSFHEAMTLTRAPVLFAPSVHARLDDQMSRAIFAASEGMARVLSPTEDAESAEICRQFIEGLSARPRLERPKFDTNGAAQMAMHISRVQARYGADETGMEATQ